MALTPDSLTLGEVAKVEELSGLSFSSIGDGEKPQGKMLAALAYVAKRREDQAFTWNDAQSLKFSDIDGLFSFDEEDSDDDDPLAQFEDGDAPKE